MKRSQSIEISILAAVAALTVAGCSSGPRQVRRCVDEKGNLLPESACVTGGRYYGGGIYSYPRWVYGGTMVGNRVQGFSSKPASGAHVVSPSGRTISRGGFGGRSFGGLS